METNLLGQMKPEFKEMVLTGTPSSEGFESIDDCYRSEALQALKSKSFFTTLTFTEIIAITHFTSPHLLPKLDHIIDLFDK